jgi:hypothetical protein
MNQLIQSGNRGAYNDRVKSFDWPAFAAGVDCKESAIFSSLGFWSRSVG